MDGLRDKYSVFETPRLKVRELTRDDFAELFSLCSDAGVMKYVGNLQPYTAPQTRQVIWKCMRSYDLHGYGGWALLDKSSGKFVGYAGFEYVPSRSMPELFYILSPTIWGKGFATEFARAAVTFGFDQLNLEQIGASFDPSNYASLRVAAKVGFTLSHQGVDEFDLPTVFHVLRRSDGASSVQRLTNDHSN
jgi:ribosomal-protein-alanine N-acetyltransferase